MENNTLNTRIVLKNDIAATWTALNPILLKGEMGIEIDTSKFKFGDGITAWKDLEYSSMGATELNQLGVMFKSVYDTNNDGIIDVAAKVSNTLILKDSTGTILSTYDGSSVQSITFTKSIVGLSNVDNTSDTDKPISTTVSTALGTKVDKIAGKGLSTNDLTDILKSNYDAAYTHSQTAHAPSNAQENVIEVIKDYAGTPLTITAKAVTLSKTAVGLSAVTNDAQVKRAEMGVANGVATLDASGLVPSTQLPSYVDDILEFANLAAFPSTGVQGKIYVALDSNKVYRWSGTAYVEVANTLDYASQAEAEAGTENTKVITALRVAQAITKQAVKSIKINGGSELKDSTGNVNLKAYPVVDNSTLASTAGSGTAADTFKIKDLGVGTSQIAALAVTNDKITSMDSHKLTQTVGNLLIFDCGNATL